MVINVDFIHIYQKDIYLLQSVSETSLMKFIDDHLWITADANAQMCILLSAEYP